jgi:SNF2 family DNA or RNA helicase
VLFEGGMSGPEKDAAVERFRAEVPLLLCTESGGEGRNLQFCNTLVNFDLPWNPMTIEQRIGRLHRIGQTRDVFIFNLAVRGTLEEEILSILDEKINMFELVVGEIDAILGEMSEEQDFAELVFTAWVETTETERTAAFTALGERLAAAKGQYEAVKALDEALFGEEFVAG